MRLQPLHHAAMQGHIDPVILLLEAGPDKNAAEARYGVSPLFYAATRGHLEIVRFLVEVGADKNQLADNGLMPLHWAAQYGVIWTSSAFWLQSGPTRISSQRMMGQRHYIGQFNTAILTSSTFWLKSGPARISKDHLAHLHLCTLQHKRGILMLFSCWLNLVAILTERPRVEQLP